MIFVCFFIVFDRYKSYSPYDMQESIRKEVKGDLEKSFLTLGETFLSSVDVYYVETGSKNGIWRRASLFLYS